MHKGLVIANSIFPDSDELLSFSAANFVYIHKALVDQDLFEIILIDLVMTPLYDENVKNDIIYINATGLGNK